MSTLMCTGRDIETRQLELRFSKSGCNWELVQDSLVNRELELPDELIALIQFAKERGIFDGGNTQLTEAVSHHLGEPISPKALKQMMNRWRYRLEEQGLFFESHRSNGQKFVKVIFKPISDESAASDVSGSSSKFCVSCASVRPQEARFKGFGKG